MIAVKLVFLDPADGAGVRQEVTLHRLPVAGDVITNLVVLQTEGDEDGGHFSPTEWLVSRVLLPAQWVGERAMAVVELSRWKPPAAEKVRPVVSARDAARLAFLDQICEGLEFTLSAVLNQDDERSAGLVERFVRSKDLRVDVLCPEGHTIYGTSTEHPLPEGWRQMPCDQCDADNVDPEALNRGRVRFVRLEAHEGDRAETDLDGSTG